MLRSFSNKLELFSEDPYFGQIDINLNSPYDNMKVDPSHIYDGLDVMNMSQQQITQSIGQVYIRQHMLSKKVPYAHKETWISRKRVSGAAGLKIQSEFNLS